MSGPVTAALRELIALGVQGQALVEAVGRIEAAAAINAKSARQERNKRYYENKKAEEDRLKASEKRLKTSETEASEKRLKASESVLNSDAPRARVKDITSNSVDRPYHTTQKCEREADGDRSDLDWPEAWPPTRPYLDQLEALLRAAAGPALNVAAPNLMILAPILNLAKAGKGPRCELHLDVLPVISARSARAPPGTVNSWEFFVAAIVQARDRRLSGSPATQSVNTHERPSPQSAKFDRHQANLERANAGAEVASRYRALKSESCF